MIRNHGIVSGFILGVSMIVMHPQSFARESQRADEIEYEIVLRRTVADSVPNAENYSSLSRFLGSVNRYFESYQLALLAVRFAPEKAEYWRELGLAAFNLGANSLALIAWKKAERIDRHVFSERKDQIRARARARAAMGRSETQKVEKGAAFLPKINVDLAGDDDGSEPPAPFGFGDANDLPDLSFGSGFIVQNQRQILTNFHVIRNCKRITVHRNNGESFTASVVNRDKHDDLAILAIHGDSSRIMSGFPRVAHLSAQRLYLGQSISAYGFPMPDVLANRLTLARGQVTAGAGPDGDGRLFLSAIPTYPGHSGSPIMNDRGDVVGVVEAGLDSDAAATIAIRSTTVMRFLATSGMAIGGRNPVGLEVRDLSNIAEDFVVAIECWKSLPMPQRGYLP